MTSWAFTFSELINFLKYGLFKDFITLNEPNLVNRFEEDALVKYVQSHKNTQLFFD